MADSVHDPLLYGWKQEPGLVAVEHVPGKTHDEVALFFRRGGDTAVTREPFEPFLVAALDAIAGCPVEYRAVPLDGAGRLNLCAFFATWQQCQRAKAWLSKKTGASGNAPNAPFLCLGDPVHQYLLVSGRTLFLGLPFAELRRMQVDIECLTTPGYEFCNAQREGDRIVAIAMGDQTGWVEVLSASDGSEADLLARFVEIVRRRDPDVIEGHNIFNFDLPYIAERARRHGIRLTLGRDGSVPHHRPSRLTIGERTIGYERFDIYGRHVVDTLFLAHAYDISHRSLGGLGLKEVALHFGLAAPDRTYIEGSRISAEFLRDPERVLRYVRDDVKETGAVAALLSASSFIQAQMLPYSYQNVCVRGSATKIDALMLREYLRQRRALPLPDAARAFAGGYTDMFVTGVVSNVHHCDVRSLYPSLMLARALAPQTDELGVFLRLLRVLREVRLEARRKAKESASESGRTHFDAMQATFKVLINSFYGYLGFSQARFSDFSAAAAVAAQGRELLGGMIAWLRRRGATPVEIDTDGIYFVPPPFASPQEQDRFRVDFSASLPPGIEVEFDGEYRAMFSYRMKNYALLSENGEVVIKGAALKSRGLEPFQRQFLEQVIRLKLEGREAEIAALKAEYEVKLRSGAWPVAMLAKTERLQDAPSTYAAKIGRSKRGRSAAYELALRSSFEYRAGDQLSYYVTGTAKSVSVHENAKLASDWDPSRRDENVAYYLAKLEALYAKFAAGAAGEQLDLGLGGEEADEGGEDASD